MSKYLATPIYSIMISGYYKDAYISVQIHLNLFNVNIGADECAVAMIEELEQLLGLV